MPRGLIELVALVVGSNSFAPTALPPDLHARTVHQPDGPVSEHPPAAEKPAACFQAEDDLFILAIPGASEHTTLTLAEGWSPLLDVMDHPDKTHVLKFALWADDSEGDRSGGTCAPVQMRWHEPSNSVVLDGWTCENFGTTPFEVTQIYCSLPDLRLASEDGNETSSASSQS